MYLEGTVKIPDVKGKITYREKGKTIYVEYEWRRVYDPERQFTIVNRKTIGKCSDNDRTLMQPNENFLKFFPEVELPEERDRTGRSCCLRIGTWIIIQKVINEYGLT